MYKEYASKQFVEEYFKNQNISSVSTPDWNQNDETAPDYIKNRPFYETRQSTEIWDGNLDTALDSIILELPDYGAKAGWVKISDEPISFTSENSIECPIIIIKNIPNIIAGIAPFFVSLPNNNTNTNNIISYILFHFNGVYLFCTIILQKR